MAEESVHGSGGQITRAGMTRAIQEGGSVLWTNPKTKKQHLITRLEHIPPASTFVQAKDSAGAALVRLDLEAQLAAISAELATLPPAPASDPKAETSKEPETPKTPQGRP